MCNFLLLLFCLCLKNWTELKQIPMREHAFHKAMGIIKFMGLKWNFHRLTPTYSLND